MIDTTWKWNELKIDNMNRGQNKDDLNSDEISKIRDIFKKDNT